MNNLGATWDELLENVKCSYGHIGMLAIGSFEFECPYCDRRGGFDVKTGEIKFDVESSYYM